MQPEPTLPFNFLAPGDRTTLKDPGYPPIGGCHRQVPRILLRSLLDDSQVVERVRRICVDGGTACGNGLRYNRFHTTALLFRRLASGGRRLDMTSLRRHGRITNRHRCTGIHQCRRAAAIARTQLSGHNTPFVSATSPGLADQAIRPFDA